MAVLDFLRRSHDVTVLHVNHHTAHADQAEHHVMQYCAAHDLLMWSKRIMTTKPSDQSWEEFWRMERYTWFKSFTLPVVTAHHLDDCVETYLFNCMHGKHHTIAYAHANVVRPFLTTPKSEFESWCARKSVPHVTDPSNCDLAYMRNKIRHRILPEALKVNPGLHTVVKKMVLDAVGKPTCV
jgi:tRNA(Ile)-lysidine synthase